MLTPTEPLRRQLRSQLAGAKREGSEPLPAELFLSEPESVATLTPESVELGAQLEALRATSARGGKCAASEFGEGTPSAMLASAPAADAAAVEWADWANWKTDGDSAGGFLDSYAATPLPSSSHARILSPLARREQQFKAREALEANTFGDSSGSWGDWDDFKGAASASSPAAPGTLSKAERSKRRAAAAAARGGGGGGGGGSSGGSSGSGGGGALSCLWSVLRPPSLCPAAGRRIRALVCPSEGLPCHLARGGGDGDGGGRCKLPKRRSLLTQFACLCALALVLGSLAWSQPRSGRDGSNTHAAAPSWLVWAEGIRTASGEMISTHLRWSGGGGTSAGGSDEWQVVRRGSAASAVRVPPAAAADGWLPSRSSSSGGSSGSSSSSSSSGGS